MHDVLSLIPFGFTLTQDNQIIFWKSTSLEPQAILSGHLASVTAVCFSSIDLTAFSVSEDRFLKVWDQQRLLRGVVAHDKEINSVHCSPNGSLVGYVLFTLFIIIQWWKDVKSYNFFSAKVATASRDKTAKIWDAESLQLIATFKGHKKGVWDAKFSSWDQLVVTASADTTIKIWSLTTYECMQV